MPTMRERLYRAVFALLVNAVYGVVLPLLARLPLPAGRALAIRLGGLYARLGLDWRTLWQQEHDVAGRTRQALGMIRPGLSPWRTAALLRQRFRYAALEDLEGHWLALRRGTSLRCRIDGLDAIRETLSHGKGIVLLTMHFDASILGIALLGQAGLKLNPMAIDVSNDPRVAAPAVIKRYFRRKYAGLDSYLNGGRVMYVPRELVQVHRALSAGEGVVILGDAPAPTSNINKAVAIDFIGQRRAFAPGFLRLAEKTGAPLAAFVCLRDARGGYRIAFSPVYWPVDGRHQEGAKSAYAFLEAQVRRHPGRWWAADLLTYFLTMDAASDEPTHPA